MSRREVTLIFPFYRNVGMWRRQLEHIRSLPPEVRGALSLIVVDDGSPPAHALNEGDLLEVRTLGLKSARLFRILVDVRWNWLAARNLAVSKAQTDWVLMTDIDHLVPESTLRRIQELKLDGRNTYRFQRVDAPDLTPYKPHPNSWLLTRERFEKIGGYDERFSGFYGTDGEFRDRVVKNSQMVIILDFPLIRVPREVVPDASTTTYGRKEPQDREGVGRVRKLIAASPKPHRLTFPWEEIVA